MNGEPSFVNGHALQLAMREVQRTYTARAFWLGLLAVVAVLTVAAPFDSGEEFNVSQRFVYWFAVAMLTYPAAAALAVPLMAWLRQRGVGEWSAIVIGGIAGGVPAGTIVYLINTLVAGNDDGGLDDLVRIIGYCLVISPGVMVLRHLVFLPSGTAKAAPQPPSGTKGFQGRLSPERRGTLLTLQAQDHYIEVTTTAGTELILLRLGDAVEELLEEDGRRVHRSWWVARGAIDGHQKVGTQMQLTLTDGRVIPVSRANEKSVRAWIEGY